MRKIEQIAELREKNKLKATENLRRLLNKEYLNIKVNLTYKNNQGKEIR
nr:MAG TPA: hypothetical protein [Caudoviricetes sp.]